MRTEIKTLRCQTHKSLPFEKLRQRLDEELEMNVAPGTIQLTPEHDGTIRVIARNRDDAQHVFQMVCNMVNISEAQARGEWSAPYPPVKITWLVEPT